MRPTMNLRWREADIYEDEEQPCARNAKGYAVQNYILQQQWVSAAGENEWRDVEKVSTMTSEIKVTVLIVLSDEDMPVDKLLLTGGYKIIKTAPGIIDKDFRAFFHDRISLEMEESGYVYMLYRVDSPAYPHPLYFGSGDGVKVSPGWPVAFSPD